MVRKVALYIVLPEERQFAAIERSRGAAWRALLRRQLEGLSWLAGRTSPITHYVWERCRDSNRGDVGIRESIKEQLRQAFPGDELVFTELAWGSLDDRAIERINADHALFVIGGSGYIALDAAGRLPSRIDRDLVAFERIRCPKIAYGIGINHWLEKLSIDDAIVDPATIEQLRRFLAGLSAISVRDARTLHELAKLSHLPIALTGDPALFLAGATKPTGAARSRLRIGLNLALHDQGMVPLFAAILPELVRCCAALARRHPVDFVYFVHAEIEYIVPRLLRRRGVAVEVIDRDPRAMLKVYSGLDLHLCQMLHSAIFAVNAGVPTVNVGYDVKNFAFFELLGLPAFCLAPDKSVGDAMLARAEEALADQRELRRQIAQRKTELRRVLDRFLSEIGVIAKAEISATPAATSSSRPGREP
jgi:hypothetical protein